jgi:sulfatase modifying factor 1
MKYKLTLLFFLAIAGIAATNKSQLPPPPDTTGMVLIEPSTFKMGVDSAQLDAEMQRFNAPQSAFAAEYPAFRVTVVPFYIDKYEVTNADYKAFVEANPQWSKDNIADSLRDGGNYLKDWQGDKYPKGKAHYPVVYVNWYAAYSYARWKRKRLPMDVELESAAKGLDKSAEFPWGNGDADATKANFLLAHNGGPVKVGSYAANSQGLYDMAGNVWEFCLDTWSTGSYKRRSEFHKNFTYFKNLPEDIDKRVIRGGSWNSPAVDLRTTHRSWCMATACSPDIGFRCAANARITQGK